MDSQTDWEIGVHLRRASWLMHAALVKFKAARLADALRAYAKYNPSQPRVPRGNPEGGEWTDGAGSGSSAQGSAESLGQGPGREGVQLAAGGFTDDQMGLTVQSFVSGFCKGSINSVLPGQFYGLTIAEVIAAAKGGDIAARRCFKLLNQDRFRK